MAANTSSSQAIRNRLKKTGNKNINKGSINKARKSRNSIPKVNQNPRPPNEPKGKGQLKKPLSNEPPANQPSYGGESAQGESSGASFTPIDDPRDANYWQDIATLKLKKGIDLSRLDLEETFSNTNYDEQLETLKRNEPRSTQNLRENANNVGEFYSSRTGEGLGRLQQDFFLQRSGVERNKQNEQSLRDLMRNAIEQGYTLDEAAAMAEAAGGASEGVLDEPVYGEEFSDEYIDALPEDTPEKKAIKDKLKRNKNKNKNKGNNNQGNNQGSNQGSGGGGGGGGQSGGGQSGGGQGGGGNANKKKKKK